jgi:hypothetical protein
MVHRIDNVLKRDCGRQAVVSGDCGVQSSNGCVREFERGATARRELVQALGLGAIDVSRPVDGRNTLH